MGGVPQPLETHIAGSLGSIGPVAGTFGANITGSLGAIGPVSIAGIPDTFHINIDHLPKIQLGVDPITLHLDPVEFSMSIKEIPSVRGHLPADFSVGLSLLGMELLCVRLCGEAQIITEPYVPNPCERCGGRQLQSDFGTNTVDVTHGIFVSEPSGGT